MEAEINHLYVGLLWIQWFSNSRTESLSLTDGYHTTDYENGWFNGCCAWFQLNLDLNNDKGEGDTSTYIENGEWHLLGKIKTRKDLEKRKS